MKTKKILLIDDEEDILQILEKALSSRGYHLQTAVNGEEGLSSIQKEKPDLIVLDVMMPELDGWELCKIIKDHSEYRDIKVLMLTAKDTNMDKLIGEKILKVDKYMVKPFDIDELLVCVERLLKDAS